MIIKGIKLIIIEYWNINIFKKVKDFKCKEYKIALNLNIIGLVLILIYCIINFIILYI